MRARFFNFFVEEKQISELLLDNRRIGGLEDCDTSFPTLLLQ